MRVTKTIKGYIEKRVYAIYQPKIDEIRTEYNAQYDHFEKILDEFLDKANQDAKNTLKESGFGCFRYDGREENIFYKKNICNDSWLNEIREKERTIRKERDEKIEEIIVTLELGGTKEELENMLNALV